MSISTVARLLLTINRFLWCKARIVLNIFHCALWFTLERSQLCDINMLEDRNLSGNFAVWVFKVSSITSYNSSSDITCSRTLWRTHKMLLFALCSNFSRMSSSNSQTRVKSSFRTHSFTTYLISCAITSFFSVQELSIRRISNSTYVLSSTATVIAKVVRLCFSLHAASQTDIIKSSWASFLTILQD